MPHLTHDANVNTLIDSAKQSLQLALDNRHHGSIREAIAIGNRVLLALQALDGETVYSKQSITLTVDHDAARRSIDEPELKP